ncbi:hypothetical protein [Labilibaculum euxinus]|uniref:Uncharacterized protein n=1 Tax=Labilibaculum euxinus TaxID=2686357 RepID=A0A7M4D528_9BACT|nr:hypothetical protein [Labilibaculum euxinus]MUP37757.1 hypothetical protein [Labilibaculum euxinus]MVB06962.1 hypothetical protein [Labilibaculum euxinus]
MSKERNYNSRSFHLFRNHITYSILLVIIGIALQYGVFSVMAVRQKMKMFDQQIDAALLPINERHMDTVLADLFKKKVFLETRFQMSKADSISLSINLKDSILQLELKGVVINSTKITDFEVDQFLYQLKPATYQHLFGTQLRVKSYLSTISKAPIVVKKAPKDTTEAQASNVKIESLKPEVVHWMLTLDKEIVLKIEGSDQYSRSDWWIGRKFWFKEDMNSLKNLKETIRFKVPEYYPVIRLVISESEAKAIYRALPAKPFVGIRL